ncbi:MAG: hypothetical protein RLZZ589_466, partial [Cyanobacteriota bacterium]
TEVTRPSNVRVYQFHHIRVADEPYAQAEMASTLGFGGSPPLARGVRAEA